MIEYLRELFPNIAFRLPLENNILVFSLILFIILLSPILLKKLNIPGIIGLIIAGVIIGPHGFYIIENNSAIDLFSTIGLLYIMFIAGLDLDLNEFKSNRNKSLIFTFYTFFIPIAIGFPVLHYLLPEPYDFNASLLTAAMFATHTLVAYPIVSKMGVAKNQAVAITVGGTILTDTIVLIMLAVIVGNAKGSLDQTFWIKLGISLAIFSFIMFFIIPKIAKWFFKKLESEKHSHYIFVLSVVFFAAFLAEVAGIESIIGAFVAGLALNKLIPNSSALMNRIEFMGNSLFIPFFLISVGMLVDVSVITHGIGAWIIAGALTVVAIFGKWLAALFTQITLKYSSAQRQVIFGLSGAHAAATLAIILVGYNTILGTNDDGSPIRLLDENILNGTIILILIASVVASFATEKAAKKLVIESEENTDDLLESSAASKEQILMPIDNVNKFNSLLEVATLIKDKKSPNPVSILSVVSNDTEAEVNIVKARNKLEEFVREASASDTNAKVLTTIDHNAASGIARVSREIMADIIILGWPQRSGFFDKLIGEKIDSILEKTSKTVFICHHVKPIATHRRIVLLVPPLAELELGFSTWVEKIGLLAQELSASIKLYSNQPTDRAFKETLEGLKLKATVAFELFTDWEDVLVLSRNIENDDLMILVSARKETTSYMRALEHLPSKLEKYFIDNNFFAIYPEQYGEYGMDAYDDISSEPLNRSIEVVQKIGKEIGGWIKGVESLLHVGDENHKQKGTVGQNIENKEIKLAFGDVGVVKLPFSIAQTGIYSIEGNLNTDNILERNGGKIDKTKQKDFSKLLVSDENYHHLKDLIKEGAIFVSTLNKEAQLWEMGKKEPKLMAAAVDIESLMNLLL